MHHKSISRAVNGIAALRPLSLLLILGALVALAGCSGNLVTAGQDGISIEGGQWTGKSGDGSFSVEFRIGTDGANIFIDSFSHPCGEKSAYVLPPHPIKAALNNGAFETTTTDSSDLLPKLVIAGKFTDKSQVEGSWDFAGYGDSLTGLSCPAASGNWSGSPGQ